MGRMTFWEGLANMYNFFSDIIGLMPFRDVFALFGFFVFITFFMALVIAYYNEKTGKFEDR